MPQIKSTRRGEVFELLHGGNNTPYFTYQKHCHIHHHAWFLWQPCRINWANFFSSLFHRCKRDKWPWGKPSPWKHATPNPAPLPLHCSSSELKRRIAKRADAQALEYNARRLLPWKSLGRTFPSWCFSLKEQGSLYSFLLSFLSRRCAFYFHVKQWHLEIPWKQCHGLDLSVSFLLRYWE